MALTTCKNCGGIVSEKAVQCPHCKTNLLTNCCPDCGTENDTDATHCISCGKSFDVSEYDIQPIPVGNNTDCNHKDPEDKSSNTGIVVVLLLCCLVIAGFVYFDSNKGNKENITESVVADSVYEESQEEQLPETIPNDHFNEDSILMVAKQFLQESEGDDFFSASFSALFDKVMNLDNEYTKGTGWLDHSIASYSQEPWEEPSNMVVSKVGNDSAYVTFTMGERTLRYDMIYETKGWRVDDVKKDDLSEKQSMKDYISKLSLELAERQKHLWVAGTYRFSAPGQFSTFEILSNGDAKWRANDDEYYGTWEYTGGSGRYGRVILTLFDKQHRKFEIKLITDNEKHLLANGQGFILNKVGGGSNLKPRTCDMCRGTGKIAVKGGGLILYYEDCYNCGKTGIVYFP